MKSAKDMTHEERLVVGFQSYQFASACKELAAMAMALEIDRDTYMMSVTDAWKDVKEIVETAVEQIEAVIKAEELLSKDKKNEPN